MVELVNMTKPELLNILRTDIATKYRTQWEFASEHGIRESQLTKVLQGKTSIKLIQRVATALGYQVDRVETYTLTGKE